MLRALISWFLGKTKFQVSVAIIFVGVIWPAFAGYIQTNLVPPTITREFRGVWVATVNNIDWPSKPGLPVEEQKREMLGILDRAAQLHLNAILFQVRPGCDAFYESRFEPWSEYLTGRMGTPPAPWYDPLAFSIDEAHKRGLELHAWFNPFRARHVSATNAPSLKHISKANPQMVRSYGKDLWLDPGEPAVRDYTMNVVMDVVRRYDVDGVVMDDYFYPYKEKDARGKLVDFPDWRSWSAYRSSGGTLARDEWRRDNINQFVERFYTSVKAEKPQVKVGLSPFGIWRPGFPAQIRGLDAFINLYADSRLWLQKGWIDYLAPQLYWPINAPNQSFPVLLKWWAEQNIKGRHLWPAGTLGRTDHSAAETMSQIAITRKQSGAGGNIHWHITPLLRNRLGISDSFSKDVYSDLALVPATPWLSKFPPGPISFSIQEQRSGVSLSWATNDAVRFWLLQTKVAGRWNAEILPGNMTHKTLRQSPEAVALSLVDRCGLTSVPDVLGKTIP